MPINHRRALVGCIGPWAVSFVLMGCGDKAPEAITGPSSTAPVNATAATTADAQSLNQGGGGMQKGAAIAGPRADPAPKGMETGNYQGGLK